MAVFGHRTGQSRGRDRHDPFDKKRFSRRSPQAAGLRLLLNEDESVRQELAFDLVLFVFTILRQLRSSAEIRPSEGNRDLLGRPRPARARETARLHSIEARETALATELVLDALLQDIAGETGTGASTSGKEPTDSSSDRRRASRPSGFARSEDAREDFAERHRTRGGMVRRRGQETRLPRKLKLRLMPILSEPRLRMIARLFGRYRRLGLRERTLPRCGRAQRFVDSSKAVTWPGRSPESCQASQWRNGRPVLLEGRDPLPS